MKSGSAVKVGFDDTVRRQARRAFWLRQLHQWHWISAALALIGMLAFAATGITLNHAAQIKVQPQTRHERAPLPPDLLQPLQDKAARGHALPPSLRAWLAATWGVRGADGAPEWSDDEVYLSLPRPGGDAWVLVDLVAGDVQYERTDRGWISYFDDLHKGRNAGPVWGWFIDVFAVACLIFSVTGLFLLQLHASRRPATWPLTVLGLLVPVVLALLFIH